MTARAALAPTAGSAWALAHFGPPAAILDPGDDPLRLLGGLPVVAIRLDDDVLTVLRRLGVKRLSDLAGVSGEGATLPHKPPRAMRLRAGSATAAYPPPIR